MSMPENITKRAPKGNVRFSITLSEEQKLAKSKIRNHPFNFVLGKAGSGKTLLAVQIALDCFFKREVNKIVITRPTRCNNTGAFFFLTHGHVHEYGTELELIARVFQSCPELELIFVCNAKHAISMVYGKWYYSRNHTLSIWEEFNTRSCRHVVARGDQENRGIL